LGSCSVQPPGVEPGGCFLESVFVASAKGGWYHSTNTVNDRTAQLDLTMTALAHPTRRAILERVMRREARVTDLAAPFDLSLNAVSKHIRVLETANLVRRRRVWREHIVSYNPQPMEQVAAWIDQQRAIWNARFDALDDLLKAEMEKEKQAELEKEKPR
jgi:DNA-binding transcriptional ArsR family regulator